MGYYSGLMTNKDMVKEIRIFNLSDLFIGRYQETFLRYFRGLKKLFVGEGLWNICLTIITTTVNCLLFLHIAKGVADGLYEVGDYSLYTGALNHIASGIGSIISTTASIYEGTLFIDNLISFMNEKPTIIPVELNDHNAGKEFRVFADIILNDKEVEMTAEEGAKTVAAALAIVESSETGKPVVPNYNFTCDQF